MENFESQKEKAEERFERADILIEVPDVDDKHFRISFECDNWGTCYAYNLAVQEVAKKLEPFHQAGALGETPHEPGRHMWEFWGAADEEKLNELLPKIQELAEERFGDQEEAGMEEYFRSKKSKSK